MTELNPGEVVRDDKSKALGMFGKAEQRVRIDFGAVALAVWIPLDRQAEAESFVDDVNRAIAAAS